LTELGTNCVCIASLMHMSSYDYVKRLARNSKDKYFGYGPSTITQLGYKKF